MSPKQSKQIENVAKNEEEEINKDSKKTNLKQEFVKSSKVLELNQSANISKPLAVVNKPTAQVRTESKLVISTPPPLTFKVGLSRSFKSSKPLHPNLKPNFN